ncbi:MAG: hypothetical protein KAS23_09795 [Anaerohalosphaera sp.]|nr:hypothetical protein [Anaerohalosphaera sp.]
MKTKTAKFTTAAVIIIAVLIGINQFGGSIDGSSIVLADVVKSMKKMPWIHMTVTINYPDKKDTKENWGCFDPSIDIQQDSDGAVRYIDYGKRVMYEYNPAANEIVISPRTDEYNVAGPISPFEIIDGFIKSANEDGNDIARQKTEQDGISVEIISISSKVQDITLVCDIERNLVLSMTAEATIPETGAKVNAHGAFDYPDNGPQDIYALGVPKNATITDTRPKGNVKDLTDEIQQRFDEGIGDHIAVIFDSYVQDGVLAPASLSIMRQQQPQKRYDKYHAYDFQGSKKEIVSLYEDIKGRWPDFTIDQVLALVNDQAVERQLLFDGKKTTIKNRYSGQIHNNQIRTDIFKVEQDVSLSAIIWRNPHVLTMGRSSETNTIEPLPDDLQRPGLDGFRIRTTASNKKYDADNEPSLGTDDYWFDPNKDYMFVERISHKEVGPHGGFPYVQVIVTETAQTLDGKWFPTVINTESEYQMPNGKTSTRLHQTNILVSIAPEFPPDFFDPATLIQ